MAVWKGSVGRRVAADPCVVLEELRGARTKPRIAPAAVGRGRARAYTSRRAGAARWGGAACAHSSSALMVRLAAAETWRQHGSPKDHALSRTFAAISSPESTPCRMNAAMRFAGPQV